MLQLCMIGRLTELSNSEPILESLAMVKEKYYWKTRKIAQVAFIPTDKIYREKKKKGGTRGRTHAY